MLGCIALTAFATRAETATKSANQTEKEGKDLLIDSSEFGIQGTVELIKAAAECKWQREWDEL